MNQKSKLLIAFVMILTFISSPAYSIGNSIAAKSKSTPTSSVSEVSILETEPKNGIQLRVSKSSGFSTKFKAKTNVQLTVIGMLPNSPVASVLVTPKGLSTNLPGSTADTSGSVLLPYISISKAGNYSILVRQPERNKSIYIRVKVI